MKKVLVGVICVSVFLSTSTYAVSSQRIKEFFKDSHEEFLDYHWLRAREMYSDSPYYNSSRFMTSHLEVTYKKKNVALPIFGNLDDYINDTPLFEKHELNYRVIHHQSYKKDDDPRLHPYQVIEKDGDLRVVHKAYGFTIGTFDKTGQFDVLNWETNGQLDLQFWKNIHFDPWTSSMFYKLFIANEDARKTRTDYTVHATQFYFRFKGDSESQIRVGSLDVVHLPGFKNATVVFVYDGTIRPIAHESDIKMDWTEDTITFDVWYRYDEQKLWIDAEGIVQLGLTENEFLK